MPASDSCNKPPQASWVHRPSVELEARLHRGPQLETDPTPLRRALVELTVTVHPTYRPSFLNFPSRTVLFFTAGTGVRAVLDRLGETCR